MPEDRLLKSRLWMVGLILIVASISAGLLTAINIYTKPMIALNAELKLKKSILDVFNIEYGKDEIIDVFNEKIKMQDMTDDKYYEYYERGKAVGVAFEIKGPGFWGPILALVALDAGLETIKGIEILRQEETPGLGGRIVEAEFKDQFKGRLVEPEITVDAITGATMTSKAFKKIINGNVKSFREKF